jgi:LacI family transcriptional regulator
MEEVEKYRRSSGAGEARNLEATVIRGINRNSDGYAVTEEIVKNYLTPGVPTGIFALNDFVAMGVIQGLLDKGIRVPEDVSVIGYDDIIFAGQFKLPLTTIHQAKHRMGKIAAHELLDAINDRGRVPLSTVLHPKLIERESTKNWNTP